MQYLVSAEEMKRYDRNTMEKRGLPSLVLMERAALCACEEVCRLAGEEKPEEKRVLIAVGTGNNGGDGLALARLLGEKHYRVTVVCIGKEEKATEQWRKEREILRNYPVEVCSDFPEGEYTILVDALFGVGISRELQGEYLRAVQILNQKKGKKLALDMPSGIDTDTGRVLGDAFLADVTITFGFYKRGLFLYPGRSFAGEVKLADVGISSGSFYGQEPEWFFYEEEPERLLPVREAGGNKGTFGKVLIIAGSKNMAGAAVLAAKAAYRTGAGMVKVVTPEENRLILQQAVPEALLQTRQNLTDAFSWADVVVIGPGMGKEEAGENLLLQVLRDCSLPVVMDADALNLLAEKPEWCRLFQENPDREVILTPHMGELSRLTGEPIAVLKEKPVEYGRKLSEQSGAVVVVKDAVSCICRKEGSICVNVCGNSGMATAGSGDVLAGIIGGLLAQKMPAFEAASLGCYLHGKAGEKAAEEVGEYGCMAGDIIDRGLVHILKKLV